MIELGYLSKIRRKYGTWMVGFVVLAGGLALSNFAGAQTKPTSALVSDDASKKAETLYQEGLALHRFGKWEEARAKYAEAWKLDPRKYKIVGNLGDCEFHLGKYKEAAAHLFTALASVEADPKADAQSKQRARELYETAKKQVGELRISVDMAGSLIEVNKEVLGISPMEKPIFVEPGEHTIGAFNVGS